MLVFELVLQLAENLENQGRAGARTSAGVDWSENGK